MTPAIELAHIVTREPEERGPQPEPGYVLITAAHNEEALIGNTIRAVVAQVARPRKWVIVSDRSSDRTAEIVEQYTGEHEFIELVRLKDGEGRDFAAKVYAIQAGCERLAGIDYSFIGILDADVDFDESYYRQVLEKFQQDPALGIAGGMVHDEIRGGYQNRPSNSVLSVAGAIQLFRRECFEAIGGLQPLEYGGEDWCAEIATRMMGWKVEAFPELTVMHRRSTGAGSGLVRYWFRQGRMDFAVGSVAAFEVIKCLRRLPDPPFVLGAMARLWGFCYSWMISAPRQVSGEMMEFLRYEQRGRLRDFLPLKFLRRAQ